MHTLSIPARAAACLLLAMAGAHAHAQQAAATSSAAADPQAAVPATRYQSTLAAPAPAPAEGSPDRNWVAANAKAAATNSMALTMKTGMGGMSGMDMGKQSGAPAMCTPAGADGQGMQCKAGCCASCGGCASCACMKGAKDAAAVPAADPHAHHHQGSQ